MSNFFKKGISTNENKSIFLGAFVSSELNTLVTLSSIADGKTKNSIIVDCLCKMYLEADLPGLILKVAEKAIEIYKKESSRRGFNSVHFYNRLTADLSKKKIDERAIEQVIEIVKGYEKTN